jgi:hypothetical protein
MDQVDRMIAWENGELGFDDMIQLFQELIDNGMAWRLQGVYGRCAKYLIDKGYCSFVDDEQSVPVDLEQ